MIQIGTYVHGGGNIEEKLIAIKEAGFDFVAIGMGALSDGTLDYQVELPPRARWSCRQCRGL